MAQQLNRDDLEFLRRFARLPEGRQLITLYQRNLAETDVRLRTAIGDELLRTQGRAQLLAELIAQVTEADKSLERATPRRLVASQDGTTGNPSSWLA